MQNTSLNSSQNDNLTNELNSSNNDLISFDSDEERRNDELYNYYIIRQPNLNEMEKDMEELISNSNNLNALIENSPKFTLPETFIYVSPFYTQCESCEKFYKIKFYDFNNLSIKCNCKIIKAISPDIILSKYCSINKIKKYGIYCIECRKDLNFENWTDKNLKQNIEVTTHATHHLINLLLDPIKLTSKYNIANFYHIKKDIELIEKSLYNIDNNSSKNHKILKNILKNMIANYKNFPNFNLCRSIKNASAFLSNQIKKAPEFLSKKDLDKELKIVYSFESLLKIIESAETDLIYLIEIDGNLTKENNINLKIMENKNLKNLKIFSIKNIKNLNNIAVLISCLFPNLSKLVLEKIELNNDFIKIIRSLKLPKIKCISLYDIKITSPDIFEAIGKFKTLEKFYIGGNTFDFSKLSSKIEKYTFPPNLIELGISNIFTEETIDFVKNYLNLEDLKFLYISYNGLKSLKIFENIDFIQLEEFWAMGDPNKGYLEDIREIKHLKNRNGTLKVINLKKNKIKNIEELVDIMPSFKNLEFLDISDNGIPKDKFKSVLGKIKEKGFHDLLIKC